ncbi:TRAP transporter small permease [Limibaculum sp. M0105]|uniref:TRAP transporter small permease protein n=1 Tax=Thermohalobaculum xanthum TaxID=2753746 RepID=A0A8J7M7I7_9RHOB|nr:TRAP transporter small permease [Thermohalobaculum xanthum]MBK0399150.1 TRAP transporter small permease [Thermohalobaculum xanthum]
MSGTSTAIPAAKHGGNPFLRAVGIVSQCCGVISAMMILAAVIITCQMIFVRFVLNASTIWQTETVIYLMIAATMLGLPYVQYLRGHVNVDLLPLALSRGPRKLLAVATLGLALLVIGAMLWHGLHFWHEAWDWGERSGSVWDPKLWVPYLALPVGFGLYFLQLVADLIAMLMGIDKPFGLSDDVSFVEARSAGETE